MNPPTDAVMLALTKTELGYIFALRLGSASPLFDLNIVASVNVKKTRC